MALSEKTREAFLGPLNKNNPVVVQILGICSALAVTVQLKPALVMGIAVTIIVALANVVISALRNTIPSRIRIIVQLVVVAGQRLPQGLRLRRQRGAVGLYRTDYHQLYSYGTTRGLRHEQWSA